MSMEAHKIDGRLAKTGQRAPSASDTNWLAVYEFDGVPGCVAHGWTTVDMTEQPAVWTHVDDFVGLGGGVWGLLVPLEGSQSMWCGARPDFADPLRCGYASLPGYGNSWNQGLRTVDCLDVTGDVTIDYYLAWASEFNYDYTFLEFDNCDDQWTELAAFDGGGVGLFSHTIADSLHSGSARVRFRFESDVGYSDEDGIIDTDGAFIVDSLTVSDGAGTVLPSELFEVENVGDQATVSGNWEAFVPEPYGDFAALFGGLSVVNDDICHSNITCMWGFFKNSSYDYSCGGHPEQAAVPYGNNRGQYLYNEVWSPQIPWTGSGSRAGFELLGYADGYQNAMIFFIWRVRSFIGSCPLPWQWTGLIYAPEYTKYWLWAGWDFGGMIAPGATSIQLAIGAVDFCRGQWWCGPAGLVCHTHAPLIDNVRIYRVATTGPEWTNWVDYEHLRFQDNFSEDGTVTGTARADMAFDILESSNPAVLPGDSAVVVVGDAEAGLALDLYTGTGSAVYGYISVSPPGQPGKNGPALTDDPVRWPVVDSLLYAGNTWYIVRMDTVFTGPGRQGAVKDRFCVDLNDNLFTPGDTIRFVFGATSAAPSNASTYLGFAVYDDLERALEAPDEFTILPAGGWQRGGDILWFNGSPPASDQTVSVQTALEILGIEDQVDRFDIRRPELACGNRPGSRVVDASRQLAGVYRKILWCTGENIVPTLGDGFTDKSDDASMLYEFLEELPGPGGVYFNGDHIADGWDRLTGTGAVQLRDYLGYSLTHSNHTEYGLGMSPFVTGEPGSPFEDAGVPDTVVAYGGCPYPRGYDLVSPTGTAILAASYRAYGASGGAIVAQTTQNPGGASVGAVLSGFSFNWIRDHGALGYPARAEHLRRILTWLGNTVGAPVGVGSPGYENTLSQNFPNPFNPSTRISYTLRKKSRVTVLVYNVAGELVRTLDVGVRSPGVTHTVEWDGRNEAGRAVSSGVYFYRLVAGDFVRTRKMVLLK